MSNILMCGSNPIGQVSDMTASNINYNNTSSGLTADDVQAAIDEINLTKGGNINGNVTINTPNSATTSGSSEIILGNNIPLGTSGNSKGIVRLYSDSGYQHRFQVRSDLSADRYLNLPDKSGDIAVAQEFKRQVKASPSTTYPTLLSYIINYVVPTFGNQVYCFPCDSFPDLPRTDWGYDVTVTLSGSIVVEIHKQLSNETKYIREVGADSQWIGEWVKQPTLLDIYPVGSIYLSVNNTNPGSLFGGTWVEWGSGRVPVGVNTNDSNFNTVEKTGGSSTVTLTTQQIPSHSHSLFYGQYNYTSPGPASSAICLGGVDATSTNVKTNDTGGGQSHNNLQPYITCYMWKRTA